MATGAAVVVVTVGRRSRGRRKEKKRGNAFVAMKWIKAEIEDAQTCQAISYIIKSVLSCHCSRPDPNTNAHMISCRVAMSTLRKEVHPVQMVAYI